jgi:hypothetical protein
MPRSLSVIIDDFEIVRCISSPHEAHAPLPIDTYAVLPFSIARQSLQPIARNGCEVAEILGSIQHRELTLSLHSKWAKATNSPTFKQCLRVPIGETLNHRAILSYLMWYVKRTNPVQ